MAFINFEGFKKIVDAYSVFGTDTLESLYVKFGKEVVDNYFDRYYSSLSEDEISKFSEKYFAYFEVKEKEDENTTEEDKVISEKLRDRRIAKDNVYALKYAASSFTLMSRDFELEQGYKLKKAKENLCIIKGKDNLFLYPKLELEKIFLSIRDKGDVDLLSLIKKLPYSLNDSSILKDDIGDIKKYLKLCKNGVPNCSVLKSNFPNLCFDSVDVLSKNDYLKQINLLKDYIVAKYNFYNRNLRLVISVANRFNHNKIPLEDAIQIGNIGLMRAIDKYDVEKGCKFSTYATWWIRQAITREIADNADLIRKPVHFVEKTKKYEIFVNKYYSVYEIMPTVSECAEALDFSEEEIKEIINNYNNVVSFDAPLKDEGESDTLGAFIRDDRCDIERDCIENDLFESVVSFMKNCISEREIGVLFDRFGLNDSNTEMTLEMIGQKLGLTRERVRQLESKTLRKLRIRLNRNNYFD